MQIIHRIDDFLSNLFPYIKIGGGGDNNSLLVEKLEEYYSYGQYKPKVRIESGYVIVDIDTSAILSQESDYKKAIEYCNSGKFAEAEPILKSLIEKNPTNSEYFRVLGQIYSELGNQDEAINYLIDSLRWNPKNGWALLMMGNIFSRFKNDILTAMKYYDQSLKENPNDYIVVTNIGVNLLQQRKFEEAKKYFWESIKINRDYSNTHYALGVIAEKENDLQSAFYSSIEAVKLCKSQDQIYQNALSMAFDVAERIIRKKEEAKIVKKYLHKLEFDCDKKIELVEDSKILTAAKIEFAENYNREKHILRYKPSYPTIQHLILHELVHLDFVIEARKGNLNQLYYSTSENRKEFSSSIDRTIQLLTRKGISEEAIRNYTNALFDGIHRQIYNTPIDLFIEDLIYLEYAELRPYQFVSLFTMLEEGIKAVTDPKTLEVSPPDLLSKSKIYNVVSSLQFKDLFGLDLVGQFKPTTTELEQAKVFYSEYLKYKEDRKPAEEYELVLHWAQDLELDKYFQLVSEVKHQADKNNQPLRNDPYQEREMFQFQRSQEVIGTNMAVVTYMVDALQYFEKMSEDNIKKIAVEIALLGAKGFHPDKKDYALASIPNTQFSGYKILAYYYISWKLALPEMLSELQLPYNDEYKVAYAMYAKGKGKG